MAMGDWGKTPQKKESADGAKGKVKDSAVVRFDSCGSLLVRIYCFGSMWFSEVYNGAQNVGQATRKNKNTSS